MIEKVRKLAARFRPGLPTDPATTMGAIISKAQYDRVRGYIASAHAEGAELAYGGAASYQLPPGGYYIPPTIFTEVTPQMTIAREEIFGPVLSVLRWRDAWAMLEEVNRLEYGLTCSIWTRDLVTAHQTAQAVQAGFVWINDYAKHFLGAPFGGFKQSGMGREECLEELLGFTLEKNINIRLG